MNTSKRKCMLSITIDQIQRFHISQIKIFSIKMCQQVHDVTSYLFCISSVNKSGRKAYGLRRYNQNRKVPGSNLIKRSAGLRDPTSLQTPGDLRVEYAKTQWLTSGEWGCPLEVGHEAAKYQLNKCVEFLPK